MLPERERGSGTVLPATLRTGSITLELLADGSVRGLRVFGRRALDGIYLAVRDDEWDTANIDVEDASWTADDDTFQFELTTRHRNDRVDMRWRTRMEGAGAHVSIVAHGTFLRRQWINRAGFAVLHPLDLEDRPVTVTTDRGVIESAFARRISAHQLFTGVTAMVEDVGDGVSLAMQFEGELFETEDHRNWTDAGWKTYCTPLALPSPVLREAEAAIRQSITLTARGFAQEIGVTAPSVSVSDRPIGRMPQLGYVVSGLGAARPSAEELVALNAAHLEVELDDAHLASSALEDAGAEARAAGAALRVTLATNHATVAQWAHRLSAAGVANVCVIDADHHVSSPELTRRFRDEWPSQPLRLGGGTDAHFAELNRSTAPMTGLDFIQYSVSSQVHHTEDSLVLDTAAALPATVRQAAELGAGVPVHVGPVTMRTRQNFNSASPARPGPLEPGPDVDDRLREPFGAVWAMAMVAGLLDADSATVLSTGGIRGVMCEHGPSGAGLVLSELAALSGNRVFAVQNSRPDCVIAIAVDTGHGTTSLFLANRTDAPLRLTVPRAIELDSFGWVRIDERDGSPSVESQDGPRQQRSIENG